MERVGSQRYSFPKIPTARREYVNKPDEWLGINWCKGQLGTSSQTTLPSMQLILEGCKSAHYRSFKQLNAALKNVLVLDNEMKKKMTQFENNWVLLLKLQKNGQYNKNFNK